MVQNTVQPLLMIRESWLPLLLGLLCVALVGGCASVGEIASADAVWQLEESGDGYGVVAAVEPLINSQNQRLCSERKAVPSAQRYCSNLADYKVATANVAATSGRSFLKKILIVANDVDVRVGDIVHFRFGDRNKLLGIASRGERQDCKWVGSPPKMMGFPFQEGGIECDGWSYKSLMHIDWKPKTWL